jgi:hypothetical protein
VLLVSDQPALEEAAKAVRWARTEAVRIRLLGQAAVISAWQKRSPG